MKASPIVKAFNKRYYNLTGYDDITTLDIYYIDRWRMKHV
ncbi:hypothetical protein SAMN04488072_107170 [Lentibacillus halodurans]|uniref:Uncharacterized protein n=1 Tax=Lentibacillus halodurans TaxID=237679 RepID=A0A1I0YIE1_9BACI|nr:hypothetical protein SAMN04488072_107170 [Lentibacillus halodurans]